MRTSLAPGLMLAGPDETCWRTTMNTTETTVTAPTFGYVYG